MPRTSQTTTMSNYHPEVMLQTFLTNEVYCTIGELSQSYESWVRNGTPYQVVALHSRLVNRKDRGMKRVLSQLRGPILVHLDVFFSGHLNRPCLISPIP